MYISPFKTSGVLPYITTHILEADTQRDLSRTFFAFSQQINATPTLKRNYVLRCALLCLDVGWNNLSAIG